MDSAARVVREARRSAGLSVRALAGRAQVPASTVTRVENGTMDPSTSTLLRLLRAAGHDLVVEPVLAPIARVAPSAAGPAGSPDLTVLRAWIDRATGVPDVLAVAAVSGPPGPTGSPVVDALVAGIAEKICDDRGEPRPSWTPRVPALEAEWSAPGTPRMRASWRAQTPPQLAARGLVVDEPSLWRERADRAS